MKVRIPDYSALISSIGIEPEPDSVKEDESKDDEGFDDVGSDDDIENLEVEPSLNHEEIIQVMEELKTLYQSYLKRNPVLPRLQF